MQSLFSIQIPISFLCLIQRYVVLRTVLHFTKFFFYREYSRLKGKYAGPIIAAWTESSDPEKSVHEDIGIAAYLLCLWDARETPVKFVDIGCGNGLLGKCLLSYASCSFAKKCVYFKLSACLFANSVSK